jgi:hypothetical protein
VLAIEATRLDLVSPTRRPAAILRAADIDDVREAIHVAAKMQCGPWRFTHPATLLGYRGNPSEIVPLHLQAWPVPPWRALPADHEA